VCQDGLDLLDQSSTRHHSLFFYSQLFSSIFQDLVLRYNPEKNKTPELSRFIVKNWMALLLSLLAMTTL
jgi:hypothetical protein